MPVTLRLYRSLLLLSGLLLTALALIGHIYQPAVLVPFQHGFDDALSRGIAPGLRSNNIVIVDIDERSLNALGQWPWPRRTMAALIDAIAAQKPRCVVLDLLFAEPDRMGTANDVLLAKSLANTQAVLGYQFLAKPTGSEPPDCLLLPLTLTLVTPPGIKKISLDLLTAQSITCALPPLAAAAGSEGFLNVLPDGDGVIRVVPLLMGWQGKLYPSLALATALLVLQDPPLSLYLSSQGVEQLEIEQETHNTAIPLDAYGQLLVNYRGAGHTFPHFSALDILNNTSKQNIFNEKIVFVGTSAAGLADLRTTPLGTNVPGVEIQATVTDNLLQGDFLHRTDAAEPAVIILVGILTSLCVILLRPLWCLIYVLFCGCGLWFAPMYLASAHRLFFSPFYPCLALLAVFVLLVPFKEKRRFPERQGISTKSKD